ncbi:PH domain-containing protein [Flavobacterium alkalisoli]|uniref:PH domain-containing protein n=1 Tax=Flavobacterium alkalisoli TaxID=2602769 RepID=A0A5B9FZY8_9FLAO|nr:PH domain-containing protein [Flavobacterium alkalisoli]QEE50582.1 PH domain-containing protein [Flavobacterium alkalisoli]
MDTINNEFENNVIDTASLPKFEEAALTVLQPDYRKIMFFNVALIYIIVAIAGGAALYFIEQARDYIIPAIIIYTVFLFISIVLTNLSFKNRGFAFRNHDVIYKSGVIATTTTIIPYNRVQHVALHEGILSRKFGLASVEVFTAGGDSSDIKISGIEKQHAENIKQLLVGKILKQENTNEE